MNAPAHPPRDRSPPPYSAAPYPQQPAAAPLPRLGPSRGDPVNAVGPVAVKPTATLACPIVSVLDRWLANSVQPAAQRWFGARVVEIKQISAYSCRGMNGNPNAHISEHAFGNALDIAAFTLADGRRITVKDGWKGMPEEQGFLRDVQAAACQQFNTVLAPGSNRYHYDHIHVDLMRRSSRRIICEPAAVSGEEIAARAGGRNPYAQQQRDPYVTGSLGGRRQCRTGIRPGSTKKTNSRTSRAVPGRAGDGGTSRQSGLCSARLCRMIVLRPTRSGRVPSRTSRILTRRQEILVLISVLIMRFFRYFRLVQYWGRS